MLTKDRLIRLCQARSQLRLIGDDAPSIDDIAKSAAMSRFHFVRQFKALFGETPVQHRTNARLDQAKRRLIYSDASITDVCLSVDFSSLGSFSALFSSRFGRSPSRFREALAASPERVFPDCLSVLRAAWERESQISRSEEGAKQAT